MSVKLPSLGQIVRLPLEKGSSKLRGAEGRVALAAQRENQG